MLNHPTHDQLQRLRLFGMARAFAEQQVIPDITHLAFEERLGLLVEREVTERDSRLTASRLRRAKLKQAAVAEDVDYLVARSLDRALFNRLLTGMWVVEHQNVLITGPTGVGKTWLACALANQACRQGKSVLYYTSELEEIQLVCDRAIAIFGGKVVDVLPVEIADEVALTRAAYGLPRDHAGDVGVLAGANAGAAP